MQALPFHTWSKSRILAEKTLQMFHVHSFSGSLFVDSWRACFQRSSMESMPKALRLKPPRLMGSRTNWPFWAAICNGSQPPILPQGVNGSKVDSELQPVPFQKSMSTRSNMWSPFIDDVFLHVPTYLWRRCTYNVKAGESLECQEAAATVASGELPAIT